MGYIPGSDCLGEATPGNSMSHYLIERFKDREYKAANLVRILNIVLKSFSYRSTRVSHQN